MKSTLKTCSINAGRMAIVLSALILALLAPTATLARGQPDGLLWSSRQDGWSALQVRPGCFLIFYQDGLVKGWGGYNSPNLEISGEFQCNTDGLAEGPVEIEFKWPMENYLVLKQLKGTAHAGVLQGQAEETIGDNQNDTGFHLRDLGDARNPSPSFYRDGCEFSDNGDGDFKFPMDEACSPSGAQAMIDQLRQAGLIGRGQAGGSSPAAPTQAPSVAATGDVFGKCVTLSAEEKRGIQDYWSLSNRCGETIIARYCFRANFENAGDPALCSQGEFRTTEIKANSSVDFTFGLTDEGTPMSNGVVAGPNALYIVGYACTGGAFPQVSFEGKQLKFQSCS